MEQVCLSEVTDVAFPPEAQEALFNHELRIAIENGRMFPDGNKIVEGVWLALNSLNAITEQQYQNLICAYLNTKTHKGGVDVWNKLSDDAIILACGGLVEKEFDGTTYRLLEINANQELSDRRRPYLESLGYVVKQVPNDENDDIRLYVHKDVSDVTVIKEPSPEPQLKPCSGICKSSIVPDGTLFCDDPRTSIKLGGVIDGS